ncbi:MAG: peptidase MA family metallohydrolase [Candidatus Omnitrophica bacterium]|nr:peptidase MA family metallohydrolase [Candidatus Omnitrophota bacterium]MDD5574170.1 peptidase MA family metallohydrolase [Candidatus Omnitrophota bacterium]
MKRFFFLLAAVLFCAVPAVDAYDFSEEKSTHFIVYYDKGVSKDFVRTVIDYAERYYNELTQKLGLVRFDYWTWDKRAKVYLYPDQQTYMEVLGQPSWSGGAAAYDQKTIWTFPREAGFFDSLLPHEIGHIILREVIGSRRVPLWFEEGIASYLEQAKRYGAQNTVLEAMRNGTFIPLADLTRIDVLGLQMSTDAALFYAESVCLVNYLIEKFGVERFGYLLRKIKEGMDFDDALAYAFFDIRSESDLGRFWEESLRKKLKGTPQTIL